MIDKPWPSDRDRDRCWFLIFRNYSTNVMETRPYRLASTSLQGSHSARAPCACCVNLLTKWLYLESLSIFSHWITLLVFSNKCYFQYKSYTSSVTSWHLDSHVGSAKRGRRNLQQKFRKSTNWCGKPQSMSEGVGLVVHFPLEDVAKINTPWPWPWPSPHGDLWPNTVTRTVTVTECLF
jgi:hypothetical protein